MKLETKKECPECNRAIYLRTKKCWNCGTEQPQPSWEELKAARHQMVKTIALTLTIIGLGFITLIACFGLALGGRVLYGGTSEYVGEIFAFMLPTLGLFIGGIVLLMWGGLVFSDWRRFPAAFEQTKIEVHTDENVG